MKRILILSDNDFVGNERCLSSLKDSVGQIEPDFDDIFFYANQQIVCFKARNNKVGKYSDDDFINYLFQVEGIIQAM